MLLKKKDLKFKIDHGKKWLKIFYHNSINDEWFNTDEEFFYCTEDNKYSIFEYITNEFKIEGFYEFLLEYPSVDGYNNWKQKIFPTEAFESLNSDITYSCSTEEGLFCSWTGKSWKGLTRSSESSSSVLDGSFSTKNYWFTIGSKKYYNTPKKFPGPAGGNAGSEGTTVSEVYLWIRVPSNLFFPSFCQTVIKEYQNLAYNLHIFIFIS